MTWGPIVQLGDVAYVLGYGLGTSTEKIVWNGRILESEEPVYVWMVVEDPDTTALPHVTEELDRRWDEAQEVERLESIAGWDPNP